MKILLDPQIFNQQTYGGISRYYTEVFSILKQRKDLTITLPISFTENAYLRESDLYQPNKVFNIFINALSTLGISTRSLRKKKSEKILDRAFAEEQYDLFIPTYYNPYFVDKINQKPFVLTVYDMIHEIMPQYFINDPYKVVENKSSLIRKASKIIAVSNNTKKDILKFFPDINPDKVEVIYHGSSIKINPKVHVDLPSKYILFVGARANYKNFDFLLKSAAPLLKKDSNLVLLAAGGGAFNEEEMNTIKALGIEQQVIQRRFEEEELGHFYSKALAFVFPSLYEGFGIPVLESMACGCPIILSTHGSFPEVAGDAGIYFDSSSEKDLTEKIESIISNNDLRNFYSAKGLEQVKKFDWNDAAEQCLKVYNEAVKVEKTK